MGRSITPKYRVEESPVRLADGRLIRSTDYAWRREYGRPTEANLERFIDAMASSQKSGGANAHLAEAYGQIVVTSSARIVRQLDGEVVASWKASAFRAL